MVSHGKHKIEGTRGMAREGKGRESGAKMPEIPGAGRNKTIRMNTLRGKGGEENSPHKSRDNQTQCMQVHAQSALK